MAARSFTIRTPLSLDDATARVAEHRRIGELVRLHNVEGGFRAFVVSSMFELPLAVRGTFAPGEGEGTEISVRVRPSRAVGFGVVGACVLLAPFVVAVGGGWGALPLVAAGSVVFAWRRANRNVADAAHDLEPTLKDLFRMARNRRTRKTRK